MTAQEMRFIARELLELIRLEVANCRHHDGSRFMDLKRTAKAARSLLMKAEELDRKASLNDSRFDLQVAGGVA